MCDIENSRKYISVTEEINNLKAINKGIPFQIKFASVKNERYNTN